LSSNGRRGERGQGGSTERGRIRVCVPSAFPRISVCRRLRNRRLPSRWASAAPSSVRSSPTVSLAVRSPGMPG